MLPKVAIVGRPNVGKSSLFNWLANVRISIVEPTPGVTRDRLSTPIELDENCWIDLIDTGGMGIVDRDNLTEHVEKQMSDVARTVQKCVRDDLPNMKIRPPIDQLQRPEREKHVEPVFRQALQHVHQHVRDNQVFDGG